MVRGADAGCCKRPLQPHGDPERAPVRGRVGDHPARGGTLLFISSSTPNSPENGPFNSSAVVAAPSNKGCSAERRERTYWKEKSDVEQPLSEFALGRYGPARAYGWLFSP